MVMIKSLKFFLMKLDLKCCTSRLLSELLSEMTKDRVSCLSLPEWRFKIKALLASVKEADFEPQIIFWLVVP